MHSKLIKLLKQPMKLSFRFLYVIIMLFVSLNIQALERVKQNFNSNWLMHVGDEGTEMLFDYDDSQWQHVTLPYAFNGHEAFARDIVELTDTICWYRKHFILNSTQTTKVYIEFEGVRQGGRVWINGIYAGLSENGVMAFGLDISKLVHDGENVIAVRTDNDWNYRSEEYDSRYQWNDKNFNANYGGIPKNVYLHQTDLLHQTLPLYSNLRTTGTYIYAHDINVNDRCAMIHVESEVRNDDQKERTFTYSAEVYDAEGKQVALMEGQRVTLHPGETRIVNIEKQVTGLHFWSWGYGYLYTVKTLLKAEDGSNIDQVVTRTGFRKTAFREGKFVLNDRVLMVHGYAQRTSNEWPGTGLSVPAWLSDYSNGLMVASGGNLVRWMHVTPWKQDIESCDRVGLIQAMPAGDAEKDVDGPRWEQRLALMRDAIIYNRNNPSIIFYECGNKGISSEHMRQMKTIRDQYDPHGGRAIGSREMLDIDDAEYGGEMLYINKSSHKPLWAMEYCRDEGLRRYWDESSWPFHKEGDGPLYRGNPANDYNHNMDQFAIEMVRRWYDYWLERPGTGQRISSGGVKIVFSDTNTHHRGESNYRTSGVVDAMRIPKDAFYAHQVMWSGWVDDEEPRTHIIGHWNYDEGTVKPIYVVSNGDEVELFVNGKSQGKGKRSYNYLYTFENVTFEPGQIEAVSYLNGKERSRSKIETAGTPHHLVLSKIENPEGMRADGADMALIQVEVVDAQNRRCPLDHRTIDFTLSGEGTWIGGIAHRENATRKNTPAHGEDLLDSAADQPITDNYVGAMTLPVECGVNRVLVRSNTTAGEIRLTAHCDLGSASVVINTHEVSETSLPALTLPCHLERGETPLSPSYLYERSAVTITSIKAGCNENEASFTLDDNEVTEWRSDGQREHAWIEYQLVQKTAVGEVVLKLAGWRSKCYPIAIYAGKKKVWEGITPASLGYVHIAIPKPVKNKTLRIEMLGPATDSSAFGEIKELAGGVANELERARSATGKVELRILEAELY